MISDTKKGVKCYCNNAIADIVPIYVKDLTAMQWFCKTRASLDTVRLWCKTSCATSLRLQLYHNNWWKKKITTLQGGDNVSSNCFNLFLVISLLHPFKEYFSAGRVVNCTQWLCSLTFGKTRANLDTVAQNMFRNLPQVAIIVYPNNWRLKHTTLEGEITFHGIVFTLSSVPGCF